MDSGHVTNSNYLSPEIVSHEQPTMIVVVVEYDVWDCRLCHDCDLVTNVTWNHVCRAKHCPDSSCHVWLDAQSPLADPDSTLADCHVWRPLHRLADTIHRMQSLAVAVAVSVVFALD